MGRIQHGASAAANAIETMFGGNIGCAPPVMVRNTFLELKEEEPEVPAQGQLARARTAPEGHSNVAAAAAAAATNLCSWSDCEAAAESDSEDQLSSASTTCDAFGRNSSLLLPQPVAEESRALSASSASSLAEDESPRDTFASEPTVQIRNTFIEMVMPVPQRPAFKRSSSVPPALSSSEGEEEEGVQELPEQDYAVSTPTGEDSPALSFFGTASPAAPMPFMPEVAAPAPGSAQQQMYFLPSLLPMPAMYLMQPSQAAASSSPPSSPVPVAAEMQQEQQPEEKKEAKKAQKKASAAQSAAADADAASKRRPAPTASETRALDLIADACTASMEHRNSSVWSLSRKDATTSALVQKAFDIVAEELQMAEQSGDEDAWNTATFRVEALIAGLHGHVHTAIEHPHANYVVQKVADLLPTEHVGFLFSELKGKAVWASKHRFGCRTMLRLVRHSTSEGWAGTLAANLVDELLKNATVLACDQFGNYVMQEVIEHGLAEQKKQLAQALLKDASSTSTTQHGSRVVEKALRFCESAEVQALAEELLRDSRRVQNMACTEYGCFVLRALVKSEEHGRRTSAALRPLASDLRKSRQGRRLLGPIFGNSQARE
mmetsp:Transcript_36543/g.85650  ORF Transcript_36543/g.85650 Transcript_36543/m.85650 type:complete len:605 (+) Transcript_36543:160-1974(+)